MRPAAVILALVIALSACSGKQKPQPDGKTMELVDTYDESAHKTRDENHPDARVIRQLIEAGANLKKPHKPDFQFEFKELEDARAVAKKLQSEGFASKIYKPKKGSPTYELNSQKEMIIEFKTMADLTDRLRKLAKEHRGEMTGWGTPVEK